MPQLSRQRHKRARKALAPVITWFCNLRCKENKAQIIPFTEREKVIRSMTNWQLSQWGKAGNPDNVKYYATMARQYL